MVVRETIDLRRRDPRLCESRRIGIFFPEDNHSAMGRVVSTSGSAELSSAKSSRASISRVKASAGLLASCGVEASVVGGGVVVVIVIGGGVVAGGGRDVVTVGFGTAGSVFGGVAVV